MATSLDKYEQLHQQGLSPAQIYLAAKADGIDEIALLKLLRTVCGLSLGDAKRITGALDSWMRPQNVSPGAQVYWECMTPGEGLHLMQATVVDVQDGLVAVEQTKKFRLSSDGLEEVPMPSDRLEMEVPIEQLQKTLLERLAESWPAVEAKSTAPNQPR